MKHTKTKSKRLSTIADIKERYNVHGFKHLPNGLVAIRKHGLWHYFRYDADTHEYELTGTTQKLQTTRREHPMHTIARQSGGNCVFRGLSTMRLALGYRCGIPKGYTPTGRMHVGDIVAMLHDWFPRHQVSVWCDVADAARRKKHVTYAGSNFPLDSNVDNYLIGFSYYIDDDCSHFVIGAPLLAHEPMRGSLCIAVKLV